MNRFAGTVLVLAAMTVPAWAIDDDSWQHPPQRVVQKGKGRLPAGKKIERFCLLKVWLWALRQRGPALRSMDSRTATSPKSCADSPKPPQLGREHKTVCCGRFGFVRGGDLSCPEWRFPADRKRAILTSNLGAWESADKVMGVMAEIRS